jgi:hypothetical protein
MRAWAVQISDLHIGRNFRGGGYVPRATAHSPKALNALSNFLSKFHGWYQNDKKVLIASGDLTSNGDPAEFTFYDSVMNRGVQSTPLVMNEPVKKDFTQTLEIPGNHDYWNGWVLPNPTLAPIRSAHFGPLPWSVQISLGNQLIAFHGLCSTSGCTAVQQVLARGAFTASDLTHVEAEVNRINRTAAATPDPYRVITPRHILVLHHSPEDISMAAHSLTGTARQQLEQLYLRCKFAGMVSGHVHERCVWPTALSGGLLPTEVRSGTTLQSYYVGWSGPRDLLVHEFANDSGFEWHMTPWQLANGGRSFIEQVSERQRIV